VFHVILYQPEIPPNTGNIIRLCANSGSALHLIRPLGFDISEKAVRRAGMDYADLANVRAWDSLEECFNVLPVQRWFAISTRGKTMRPGNRSLNLSNAAAVVVYEAWRQLQFA
jgi:tRNA (cytidine/uridine-2'-O-)-methyltransferase